MSWQDYTLDTFIAPGLSRLKTCSAPEIPALPNYLGSLYLNQILGKRYEEATIISIANAIRRTSFAITNYRAGRQHLLTYVESLPDQKISDYFQALSYFETCILHTYTVMVLFKNIFPKNGEIAKHIITNEDSLKKFSNKIKHFDDDIKNHYEKVAVFPLNPIWITGDGIDCIEPKDSSNWSISFCDIAEKLKSLADISRILSERVPEMILAAQSGLN